MSHKRKKQVIVKISNGASVYFSKRDVHTDAELELQNDVKHADKWINSKTTPKTRLFDFFLLNSKLM
jgi:hypothetical protein